MFIPNTVQMPLPVAKVLNQLFDQLYQSTTSTSALNYSAALGSIANSYPEIWSETVLLQFDSLSPSTDAHKWVCLLTHLSSLQRFNVPELVDLCVTSIHSVDIDIRRASSLALRSLSQPELVISTLLSSLELHSVNFQIFDLLISLDTSSMSDEVLTYLIYLLTEESDLVLSQYLSSVCQTIVKVIEKKSSSPANIVTLWELVSPLCWSQALISSSTSAFLSDVVRASSALLCVLPSPPPPALHSVQTALMRAAIHARSHDQLVAVIGAIHILLSTKKLFYDDETVSSFVPILIDLGIAMGLAWTGSVQQCMLSLWADMSDRGISFLVHRLHATKLSLGDQFVCLTFLTATGKRSHDSLLDSIVASRPGEAFIRAALLDLIISSCASSVPVLDWVLAQCTMKDATSTPSSLRHYWFDNTPPSICTGPSLLNVQEKAQLCLPVLKSCRGFQDRLVVALRRMPVEGLDVLLANLDPVSDSSLSGEIAAWEFIRFDGCNGNLLARIFPQDPSFVQSVCETSLRVLKKLEKEMILNAFSLFSKTIEYLPDSFGEQILTECFTHHESMLIKYEPAEEIYFALGECIGTFSKSKFPEFLRIQTFLLKKKNRIFYSNETFWFCVSRIALGVSARIGGAQITPIFKPVYIDPCLLTLVEGNGIALVCTLRALCEIFESNPAPPGVIDAVLNVRGDVGPHALRALAAVADASATVAPEAYARGIQLALQYVATDQTVTSKALVALLRHSQDAWLSLGELSRAAQLAGLNGSDPHLRRLYLEVLIEMPVPSNLPVGISQLEYLLSLVPRLRDPATRQLAQPFWDKHMQVVPETYLPCLLTPNLLSPFTILAVQSCVTDACVESSVYLLELLNEIFSAQGSHIDSIEAARLTNLMIQRADNHVSVPVRRKILECVHTLSALHLDSTLKGLMTRESFTEGHVSTIKSILKVRRLCVGFLNFVGGLMVADNDPLAIQASRALLIAFEEAAPVVRKHAAVLFGTVWLFGTVHPAEEVALMEAWSKCVNDHSTFFQSETNASDLAFFLIPFAPRSLPLLTLLVPCVSAPVGAQIRDLWSNNLKISPHALSCLRALQARDPQLITPEIRSQVITYLSNDPTEGISNAIHLLEAIPNNLAMTLIKRIFDNETFSVFLTKVVPDTDLKVEISIRAYLSPSDSSLPNISYGILEWKSVLARYFDPLVSLSLPMVMEGAANASISIANKCSRFDRKHIIESILSVLKIHSLNEETRQRLVGSLGNLVFI